jgi:hypothetical protein
MTTPDPTRTADREPPFDELYALFVKFQRDAKADLLDRHRGDLNLEEVIADMHKVPTPDEFRALVDGLPPFRRRVLVELATKGFDAVKSAGESPAGDRGHVARLLTKAATGQTADAGPVRRPPS